MLSQVRILADRRLEFDGQPFFPLQARYVPVGATLKDLADAGFNCFRHCVFGTSLWPPEVLPENLHGLKVSVYLHDRPNLRAGEGHQEALADAVLRFRELPDLLAYETCNEPAWRPDRPTEVFHSAKDLAAGYQVVRELDPNHPVHQLHSCSATVEGLRQYNAAADILGCNPYPVIPAKIRQHIGLRADGRALDTPDQTISAVGDYVTKMLAVGQGRKPVWPQVQAMAWEDFYNERFCPQYTGKGKDPTAILYPTYEQMRYMAFADIICGASGLVFSMYCVPLDQSVWQDIKHLVGELRGLHDVLAGKTSPLRLRARYRNLGFSIWKGVQTLVKEHAGRLFLLAANSAFDPAEVTWTGFEQTDARVLRVLGEDRQVTVRAGAATDFFDPYAVHVYALS